MNTAERLAAALKDLRAEVDEMASRCGWAGNGARDRADAALAHYHDTTRPLEVGDRVRVTGSRYVSDGLKRGSVGKVARVGNHGFHDMAPDLEQLAGYGAYCYGPGELVRIPGGEL